MQQHPYTDRQLLMAATSALRDLSEGWPASEISSPGQAPGLNNLLRVLVGHLRAQGVNDEGGWDCPATVDIPIAQPPDDREKIEPFRLKVVYALASYAG